MCIRDRIIRDVELDGCARSVSIEHVVDAALHVHDQWDLHHRQVQFFAQVVLDISLSCEEGSHGFLWCEERPVVGGQDLLDFFVCADSWSGKVRGFVAHDTSCVASYACLLYTSD